MTGEGEGKEGTFPESWGLRASVSSSPVPLPLQPFFCFRSNFRAITRLETLATQATLMSTGSLVIHRPKPLRSLRRGARSAFLEDYYAPIYVKPAGEGGGKVGHGQTGKSFKSNATKFPHPGLHIVIKYPKADPKKGTIKISPNKTVQSLFINVACSRLSDSGEDAKEKGTRNVRGAGKRKKEGREPVIIYFTTLFRPLLARLR